MFNLRKISFIICTLLIISSFSSLNSSFNEFHLQKESIMKNEYPIIINDDINRTITIDSVPESVISLSPSTTELLFSIGLDNTTIIAVDNLSDYPSEVNTIKQKINIWPSIDIESVISLSPDIVIGADILSSDDISILESFNVEVVILGPQTIDGIIRDIEILGSIFNCTENLISQIDDLRLKIDLIRENVSNISYKPKIYIEYMEYWTYGPKSIGNNFIELAGGINIGKDLAAPYAEINSEYIIVQNPDIIFYSVGTYTSTTIDSITNRTGWSAINAVKKGNIFSLDDDSLSRPTVRIINLLIEVNQIINEFLTDYEPEDSINQYSSSFYFWNLVSIGIIIIIRKKIRK